MRGNKGEWSELYTLFKLLADGKLYAADENTNKMENVYYDILKAIRSQTDGKWEYIRNGNVKIVEQSTGTTVIEVPIEEFLENSKKILEKLQQEQRESAFEIPDIGTFARKVRCNVIKAKSSDKSDITLVVHDIKAGSNPELGFSIKSQVGGASTLLNASKATNFVFEITGKYLTDVEINTFNNFTYFKDKFEYLDDVGARIKFEGIENESFEFNLTLIDTQLPVVIASLLEMYYRKKATDIEKLTDVITEKNILSVPEYGKKTFYEYKIKEFLTNIALGMTPASEWLGNYDATGGYIIVKEDGDILCYHIYNRNEFREYLFKNTKLETPSQTRHGFGSIEHFNGKQKLKLNLQIRFMK